MEVLLLLGGDLGDLRATFARASDLLAARCGPIRAISRDHWTEPLGFQGKGLFLNRALLVEALPGPEEMLQQCLAVERELGRIRTAGGAYHSRPIDIDILLWGERIIDLHHLQVPHPRMHERAFALAPAADIAPDRRHPGLHRSVLTLLNDVLRST